MCDTLTYAGGDLSTGSACLVAKALDRLVAMGNSRPRTLAKLCAALQSCTAVIPYVNPLELVASIIRDSDNSPPRVQVLRAGFKVYVTRTCADGKFLEMVKNTAKSGERHLLIPTEQMASEMSQEALQWLLSNHEGTEEYLLDELRRCCWKEQTLNVGQTVENLREYGFVRENNEGAVSYHLPPQSDVLALKMKMDEFVTNTCRKGPPFTWFNREVVVYTAAMYHPKFIQWNPRGFNYGEQSDATFRFGQSTFAKKLDVTDVHALCLLARMRSDHRPTNLPDLLQALKPAGEVLYTVFPGSVILHNIQRLRHRPVLAVRMQPGRRSRRSCVGAHEFAIGSCHERQETIPLTPEGVFGIGGTPGVQFPGTFDLAARWRVFCEARAFAAQTTKYVTPLMQQPSAVLVQASEQQKTEMIRIILDWLQDYQSNDSEAHEIQPVPINELHRELIKRCTGKVTKINPLDLVRLLEKKGFISVDRDDPSNPICYHISQTAKETSPAWRTAAKKYLSESLTKCYSTTLSKYFPAEDEIQLHRRKPARRVTNIPQGRQNLQNLRTIPQQSRFRVGLFGMVGTFLFLLLGLLISWSKIV